MVLDQQEDKYQKALSLIVGMLEMENFKNVGKKSEEMLFS